MAEEMNVSTNEILVDDGSQRVPIKNKFGDEIGVFYFRPTDIAMIDRYNETVKNFDEIVKPLENANIQADGTADEADEDSFKAIKEAEKRLFKACDYIFDGNMSEAFFGKMHPFSPINGAFYCETAINVLGAYIEKQFNAETAKISKRLKKYTGKYTKGGK